MQQNRGRFSAFRAVVLQLVLLSAIALKYGVTAHPGWYKLLFITIPLLVAVNLYLRWKALRVAGLKKLNLFTLHS